MTLITVWYPHKTERFENVTDVDIKNGVLTFYWKDTQGAAKKVTTNAPFTVEEIIASLGK